MINLDEGETYVSGGAVERQLLDEKGLFALPTLRLLDLGFGTGTGRQLTVPGCSLLTRRTTSNGEESCLRNVLLRFEKRELPFHFFVCGKSLCILTRKHS